MFVSVFKDAFSTVPVNCDVQEVLACIQQGRWADKIYYLRSLEKEQYDKEKLSLPAITFSGVFAQRLDKEVVEYSGLMIIDIDHVDSSQLVPLKTAIAQDKHTYALFVSPGGNGLKILFRMNNVDPSKHKIFFAAIQKHFEDTYAIAIDKSGKNVGRLCFVSYDPELYFNDQAIPFDAPGIFEHFQSRHYRPVAELTNYNQSKDKDSRASLQLAVKWVERHYAYSEGQRNIFIHAVACALNRIGIDMDDCNTELITNFDLDQEEIKKAVKSAYFHHKHEYGTYNPKTDKEFVKPAYLPNYTDDVVKNDIIEKITKVYTGDVSRDDLVAITGRYARSLVQDGFLQLENTDIAQIITDTCSAIDIIRLEDSENKSMITKGFAEMSNIFAEYAKKRGELSMGIQQLDEYDILIQGNAYGLVGMPETFKSILAAQITGHNAQMGVPVLYLHGEMSNSQVFVRQVKKELGVDLLSPENKLRAINDPDFILGLGELLQEIYKHNLYVVTDKNFTEESIIATIEKIRIKDGKEIRIVIVDGITQMDWLGREEINAAIFNSSLIKEIAKKTNTAIVALYHTSGNCQKYYRNTVDWIRGGQKVTSNFDGTFMLSLIVDPRTNELQNNDIIYQYDKFYFRFHDKRGNIGTVNSILSIDDRMRINYITAETGNYELKINKQ